MPTRYRSGIAGPTTFFLTTMLREWRKLFESPRVRDEVEDILFHTSATTSTALIAYCIMLDHVHLIAGHGEGGPGISRMMQQFKSLVSHKLFPDLHGIWVPRFDDVVLTTESIFLTKINYVHENPVRAGLVVEATLWKWSSARFWLQDEEKGPLTKSREWTHRAAARQARAPGVHADSPLRNSGNDRRNYITHSVSQAPSPGAPADSPMRDSGETQRDRRTHD